MAINELSISYPDFKLNDIIDPEQHDINNQQLVTKINQIRTVVNQITDATAAGGSGADMISLTAIAPFTSTKLQTFLNELLTRLKNTSAGTSGASLIGATPLPGLAGDNVGAQLQNLKSMLDTLSTTYYNKTEVDQKIGNLQAQITQIDPDAGGAITADPNAVPNSNTGMLATFISWFTNRIKAIVGKTNWYDNPRISLENAADRRGDTFLGDIALESQTNNTGSWSRHIKFYFVDTGGTKRTDRYLECSPTGALTWTHQGVASYNVYHTGNIAGAFETGRTWKGKHTLEQATLEWASDSDHVQLFLGDYGANKKWLTFDFGDDEGTDGDRVRFRYDRNDGYTHDVLDVMSDRIKVGDMGAGVEIFRNGDIWQRGNLMAPTRVSNGKLEYWDGGAWRVAGGTDWFEMQGFYNSTNYGGSSTTYTLMTVSGKGIITDLHFYAYSAANTDKYLELVIDGRQVIKLLYTTSSNATLDTQPMYPFTSNFYIRANNPSGAGLSTDAVVSYILD